MVGSDSRRRQPGSVLRHLVRQRSQPQVDAVNAKVGRENVLRYIANPVLTGFTPPKLLWFATRAAEF
jgi:sugar (pentulose or hexulose) kinase